MLNHRITTVFLRLFTLLFITGCGVSTVRMAVPHGIENKADHLAVQDRSQFLPDSGFRLGEYRVSDVDRGWTTTTAESVGPVSNETTTGSYSYTLSKAGELLNGRCTTGETGQHVDLGSGWSVGEEQHGLTCSCGDQAKLVISTDDLESIDDKEKVQITYEADGQSASPWFSAGEVYRGRLFIGNDSFEVTALYEAEGGINLSEPLGYRVSRSRAFVGMVEVLSPGNMWLAKGLSTHVRDHMSCLMTGLMFYRPD